MFRPKTYISTYSCLANNTTPSVGQRSQRSTHELCWTVLGPVNNVPHSLCCSACHPILLEPFSPSGPNDARLYAFADNFIHPLAYPPSRPSSALSHVSTSSVGSAAPAFQPLKGPQPISQSDKAVLRTALNTWLDIRHARLGSSVLISRDFGLPPKQMEKLLLNCGKFLKISNIGKKEILKVVTLDVSSDLDIEDIALTVSEWRDGLQLIRRTPESDRRTQKRSRPNDASTPIPQPSFGPISVPSSTTTPMQTYESVFRLSPLPTSPASPVSHHHVNQIGIRPAPQPYSLPSTTPHHHVGTTPSYTHHRTNAISSVQPQPPFIVSGSTSTPYSFHNMGPMPTAQFYNSQTTTPRPRPMTTSSPMYNQFNYTPSYSRRQSRTPSLNPSDFSDPPISAYPFPPLLTPSSLRNSYNPDIIYSTQPFTNNSINDQ